MCLGIGRCLQEGNPIKANDHPVVRWGRVFVTGGVEACAVIVPAGREDWPREGDIEPDGVIEGRAIDEDIQVHGGFTLESW